MSKRITKKKQKAVQKAWDEALESGKYNKGQGSLCSDVVMDKGNTQRQHCCLGVLGEVINDQFPEIYTELGLIFKHNGEDDWGNEIEGILFEGAEEDFDDDANTFLPHELVEALGFADRETFEKLYDDDGGRVIRGKTIQYHIGELNDEVDSFKPVIKEIKRLRKEGLIPKKS